MVYGAPLRRLARALAERGYDEIITFRQESPKVLRWMRSFAGAATVRTLDSGLRTGAISSHPIDMYRAALAAGGFDVAAFDERPLLAVDPAALERTRARVRALGARVVSLQAGSSLTHRWWRRRPNLKGLAPAQWAGLIARLVADGDADAIILHGSRLERREAQAVRAAVAPSLRARVHDWTGRAPLEDLPGIFSHVRALLAVDTGPAHIAAAVGCPTLVFYGPSDPRRWLPRGHGPVAFALGSAPCQFCVETPLFRTCRRNVCMEALTAEAIHAAWARLRAHIPAEARG